MTLVSQHKPENRVTILHGCEALTVASPRRRDVSFSANKLIIRRKAARFLSLSGKGSAAFSLFDK